MLELAVIKAKEASDDGNKLLMISSDQWHEGVLGIVASRIKEQFNLPAAMVAINPETGRARASLRAPAGINLITAMEKVSEKLRSYGGHTAAAGMTFDADRIADIHRSMDETIKAQLEEAPKDNLPIDAHSRMAEIDHIFAQELSDLAPFGIKNPEPMIMVTNIRVSRHHIVNEKHLRVQFKENHHNYEVIGFGLANRAQLLDQSVDLVLTPRQATHKGKTKLDLQIKTMRGHERQQEER
jgi:single-stranded-DNA-specific exonuclease